MPLTVSDGALVGAGMVFASGATMFYRRKQTLPFKAGPFEHFVHMQSSITPSSCDVHLTDMLCCAVGVLCSLAHTGYCHPVCLHATE